MNKLLSDLSFPCKMAWNVVPQPSENSRPITSMLTHSWLSTSDLRFEIGRLQTTLGQQIHESPVEWCYAGYFSQRFLGQLMWEIVNFTPVVRLRLGRIAGLSENGWCTQPVNAKGLCVCL